LSTASLRADVVFKSLNPIHVAEAVAVQGGLLLGKTETGNKVWLDKQSVRVAKDGTFIIGFGRDAASASLLIEQKNGEQQHQQINIQSREYKIDRIDGLPPAKVNPKGEAVLKRIREESALTRKARSQDDERQDFKPGFIWPAKGRISGVYGSQRILNGEPKWPHYGVDIAAPTGSAVVAP
ncbi:MAG: M23 family peptidase, partial [Gammaproteobacteria bacterium]|nr:M23 family peptidase [Gammaproteobacteria bacterium]